jgi:O-antigen/teichoic acid export membrane protein
VIKTSYSSLLRSSYLIGGAQIVFILTGLIKMKVAAVLLGPAGVGLVGLYMNLMQATSTVASMGIGHAGTKQISAAQADLASVEVTRKTLYLTTVILAIAGAGLFWLSRAWVAEYVVGDVSFTGQVGWLSLGIALSVAAVGQNALLTGLRHVGDLARVSIGTGVIGTVISVLALWIWREQAILVLVIVVPAMAFILGHVYAARIKRADDLPDVRLMQLVDQWRSMRQLGLSFMAAGLATLIGPLIVRALVQRELGLEAAGQFQAAWSISLTYMGLVLGVMTSDFHPRLVATIDDKQSATQLVNEQTDVAVLICAPLLLLLLGLAPWVIRLLYTAEFAPAVEVLRWQLLGDVLKVMCFPLGFVLLASGASTTFLLLEILGMMVFVLLTWFGLPLWGIKATGIAFLLMYIVYLPAVWFTAKRLINFRWTPMLRYQALMLLACAVSVVVVNTWSEFAAAVLSVLLAVAAAGWAIARLKDHVLIGQHKKTI